ncbi:WcaI family glycosyltransferase [Chitinophaga vietnamensis]|uniref:WcaI family glycosyltransferase n=1 Tax=Chitinophaga vietnamensis TaxID=2593957 RepID=UPI0011775B32|nr:WcaI family glycosyltransferase [Chitinophaga vietnamensis]
MRLLLITGFFAPEPSGIGKYNGEMISWLAARGHECTVITTYPFYPQWRVQAPYHSRRFLYTKEKQGNVTIYRCPQYVPARPSGMKRMILDASFCLSSAWKLLQLGFSRRYDVVMTVAPSFQLGLLAALYKKCRRAKFIYHIQDLQIEAARDLQMIRSGWLIRRLLQIERFILKRADVISSISTGMIRRISEKAGKEVLFFPNWVDTRLFYPIADRNALKAQFGFSVNDKVILYSGAIGEKQGLEAILHAAVALKHQPALKFLICGSGPYQQRLSAIAAQHALQNVTFLPLQPAQVFNQFLNMADVHLIIQKASASDLVMPSKLTTIMAVGGLAIVTANSGTSLHSLIQQHQIGMLINAEDQEALREAISKAIYEPAHVIRKNARAFAENYLSIEKVMTGFEAAIS